MTHFQFFIVVYMGVYLLRYIVRPPTFYTKDQLKKLEEPVTAVLTVLVFIFKIAILWIACGYLLPYVNHYLPQ